MITCDTTNTRTVWPKLESLGDFLNSRDTFAWLMDHTNLVGWTFTVQPAYISRFKKLIVGGTTPPSPSACVRWAPNTHIKAYIAHDSALFGSYNLTHPTIEDLMVVITKPSQRKQLLKLFNTHWRELK